MHNEPLHRYVKLRVAHALGIPGTFSPPPRVSEAVDKEYFLTCVSIQTGLMVGLCALEANDEQQSKLFQYIEAEKMAANLQSLQNSFTFMKIIYENYSIVIKMPMDVVHKGPINQSCYRLPGHMCVIQTGLMVGLCALEAYDEQQSKLFQYIEAEKNGRQFAVTSKFIHVHENYL